MCAFCLKDMHSEMEEEFNEKERKEGEVMIFANDLCSILLESISLFFTNLLLVFPLLWVGQLSSFHKPSF